MQINTVLRLTSAAAIYNSQFTIQYNTIYFNSSSNSIQFEIQTFNTVMDGYKIIIPRTAHSLKFNWIQYHHSTMFDLVVPWHGVHDTIVLTGAPFILCIFNVECRLELLFLLFVFVYTEFESTFNVDLCHLHCVENFESHLDSWVRLIDSDSDR